MFYQSPYILRLYSKEQALCFCLFQSHKRSHYLRYQLSVTTTEYNCDSKHTKCSRTRLYTKAYTVDLAPPASPMGSCISSLWWQVTQTHTACPFPLPIPFPLSSFHGGKHHFTVQTQYVRLIDISLSNNVQFQPLIGFWIRYFQGLKLRFFD